MGEDGAVTLGHDSKGEGTVVVLHHTHVVVALRQGGLRLDVETVGVPYDKQLIHSFMRLASQSHQMNQSFLGRCSALPSVSLFNLTHSRIQ